MKYKIKQIAHKNQKISEDISDYLNFSCLTGYKAEKYL